VRKGPTTRTFVSGATSFVIAAVVTAWIGGSSAPATNLALATRHETALDTFQGAAGPGENTYELSDFIVTYPYVDPFSHEVFLSKAEVSYDLRWRGRGFPGKAQCMITLYSATGEKVGEDPTEIISLKRAANDVQPQQVDVSGVPVSASGACGAAVYPENPSYEISDFAYSHPIDPTTGEKDPNRLLVAGRVAWTGGPDPIIRTCLLSVQFKDGTRRTFGPVDLSAPDDEVAPILEIPVSSDDEIVATTAQCRPVNPTE
jgi:hypothetical protein